MRCFEFEFECGAIDICQCQSKLRVVVHFLVYPAQSNKSHLSSMVADTGPDNAAMLRQVALTAEAHRGAAAAK